MRGQENPGGRDVPGKSMHLLLDKGKREEEEGVGEEEEDEEEEEEKEENEKEEEVAEEGTWLGKTNPWQC